MDKIKHRKEMGIISTSAALKKLTEYVKPKIRMSILPTITTVIMKSFVLGVIIYGTHEAKVWGTPNETADLWMRMFKPSDASVRKQNDFV